jgi:hypothetical protein
MLFCTSLVAYVGAGEQPALTPRKLTVVNTSSGQAIQHISFVRGRGRGGRGRRGQGRRGGRPFP